jgi:hypothetical protein
MNRGVVARIIPEKTPALAPKCRALKTAVRRTPARAQRAVGNRTENSFTRPKRP